MGDAIQEFLSKLYVLPQLMLIGICIIGIFILASAWYHERGHRS